MTQTYTKNVLNIMMFNVTQQYNLLLLIWTHMKTFIMNNKHTRCLIPNPTLLVCIVLSTNSRKLNSDKNERRLLAKFQSPTTIDVPIFRYGQLVRLYGRIQEPHSSQHWTDYGNKQAYSTRNNNNTLSFNSAKG